MRLSTLFATGRRRSRNAPDIDAIHDDPAPTLAGDADDISAQAILWHVRLRGGGAAARAAFTDWLERDPRHAAVFASIRGGATLGEGAANDGPHAADARRPHFGRWGAGGAVAMSILALATIGTLRRADPYEVTTPAGARRVVALAPGTRVTLNGGTRIRLDRQDPRVATLLAGEALFEVRHDAARPFRLSVAGRQIEDVGTTFNVVSDGDEVRVAVAEGSVLYNPAGEKIALHAGQGLVDPAAGRAIRLLDVPAAAIGGWRRGQLVYTGQPVAQVAADLSRTLGIRIVASPAIAARPFSGAIALPDDGGRTAPAEELARLAPALDLRLERTSDGWMLKPGNGAAR